MKIPYYRPPAHMITESRSHLWNNTNNESNYLKLPRFFVSNADFLMINFISEKIRQTEKRHRNQQQYWKTSPEAEMRRFNTIPKRETPKRSQYSRERNGCGRTVGGAATSLVRQQLLLPWARGNNLHCSLAHNSGCVRPVASHRVWSFALSS